MGIRNIHMGLITCSTAVGVFFGIWALNHAYSALGTASLAASAALAVYGVMFFRKSFRS